ncbi:MAG: type III pantothenate kinase [Gammaproteobacteria bacterium]|nr:type III pantothenate kinase [Gammaproteobacteria bacterium]
MKLLIDVGNQRTKLLDSCRLSKKPDIAPDVVNNDSPRFAEEIGRCLEKIELPNSIWISSVSNPVLEQLLSDCVFIRWGLRPEFLKSTQGQNGVNNHYINPSQLGVDRWMAIIAARHVCKDNGVIVIDAGTAVTLDYVDVDGGFRGGVIFPGIQMMQKALNMQAEKITIPSPNSEDIDQRLKMTNTDTQSAVKNGAELAVTAAIESGINRILLSWEAMARVVITGGDSKRIMALTDYPIQHHANLVLQGINVVAEEVQQA